MTRLMAARWQLSVVALGLLAGCASIQSVPPAARADLASTGKLRVGLILSNQVLVTKDAQAGELRGVTIVLGKALAKRLGVPFEPVGYPNPAALVQSFGRNEWDIAFLAFDPARARDVEFSPPYMVVDNTYLVPSGSKLESVESADLRGVKIAVPERSAPDLFLSRNLKAAEIVRVPGGADAAIEPGYILSTFEDSATVFFPNTQPQRANGKAEIREVFAPFFKQRTGGASDHRPKRCVTAVRKAPSKAVYTDELV